MSVYESNLASSDIAFRGYLIQAETTARSAQDEGGVRIYKYLIIEPFKGNIKKNEIVEVSQNRTYCSFNYSIDKEHLVYLTKDKNGLYQFGMAHSGPLYDQTLDMEKKEDVELYQEIVEAGLGSDYVVRSYFPDGTPRIYTYSIKKSWTKFVPPVVSSCRPPHHPSYRSTRDGYPSVMKLCFACGFVPQTSRCCSCHSLVVGI
ncbi:hypothetical protein [Microbulbifer sp. VAAF005]|uniref:hypothetical protein n=1 Tax=Microbulbifer sp. VAAF005 TaxID=3034230 RepID=UPI0024ADB07A|nr:hypothetical protein [Microbulbifer sp. VAAF005]WHI48438.1 hypothetical protein P0078_08715 [Microbulbifer sp. VAAF005]